MSDFETFDVSQQRAKQRAEQNACEQAGVYIESRTEVQNAQVTRDEIITMTSGILKIVDVQFKREIVNDNTTRIRAIVAQNEGLRRANAEQDKQIAALKQQLADVKTQADRERITQQFAAEDKIFLSNQKVDAGWHFVGQKDFDKAIVFFNQAIELNPNNAQAYFRRSAAYQYLKNYNQALADNTKAIELLPNNAIYYVGCSQLYLLMGNKEKSHADYEKARQLGYNAFEEIMKGIKPFQLFQKNF